MSAPSLGVGAIAGIVAGSVILLAMVGYILFNTVKKRKTEALLRLQEAEAAMKMSSRENLVGRKMSHGFTQQRTDSPAPSYVLAPNTSVVNWGDRKSSLHSACSSFLDLPRSRNGSVASLPYPPMARKNASPLRLNPSSVSISGRVSPSGSVGGSYMPPLPPSRSMVNSQASGWVSPLDVHFSRPSTPQAATASTQQSYFPRLQYPSEVRKSALFVPKPGGSFEVANSEAASIVSSTVAAPQTVPETFAVDFGDSPKLVLSPVPVQTKPSFDFGPSVTAPGPKPATADFNFNFNFFSDPKPKPASIRSRGSRRSIFPVSSEDGPVSRRSIKDLDLEQGYPLPAVPSTRNISVGPRSPNFDPSVLGDKAVFRQSVVSKRSVSIYVPDTPLPQSDPRFPTHDRTHSRAASSVYSNLSTRSRSISPHSQPQPPAIPSRSHLRSRSTSLTRTQDSLRHSRTLSSSLPRKRHSRDRDQLHYDPSPHRRNRSGSVQGRSVDFDHPRDSPFSASITTITPSARSSISVATTTTTMDPLRVSRKPSNTAGFLGETLFPSAQEPNRLSVATAASRRGRSASEASQASMGFGDFYDAYYRLSGMRGSVVSQAPSGHGRKGGSEVSLGAAMAIEERDRDRQDRGGRLPRGRPPSLKLPGSALGLVVEVASPLNSPMGAGFEKFPSRI